MTNTMYQDLDVKGIINAINGSPELIAALRQQAIPVGASMYCAESPAAYYGGTWVEQDKDKFPLAAGDTYAAGTTGGSADAVVVSHRHEGIYWANDYPIVLEGDNVQLPYKYELAYTSGPPYNDGQMYTGHEGESGIGKNMPPYTAKKFWTKIA